MGKISLTPKTALQLLRQPGHRLMLMFTNDPKEPKAYYLVPGGYVSPEIAAKLLERPDVVAADDGLFPGNSQTWTIGDTNRPQS